MGEDLDLTKQEKLEFGDVEISKNRKDGKPVAILRLIPIQRQEEGKQL